jgi:hypothetical protein
VGQQLTGSRVKIARAKKHLEELDRAVNGFLKLNPYEIYNEFDPRTGEEIWRIKVSIPPPVELGGIVGDIVHNLRSALDLAICQLVLINGGKVSNSTEFPIFTDRTKYQAKGRDKVKGVSPAALKIIDYLQPCNQPYPPEDHMFYVLHRLDMADKHRLITPVTSAVMGDDSQINISNAVLYGMPQARGVNPVENGAEFLRLKHISKKPNTQIEPRLKFELVFDKDGPGQGQPILHLLPQVATFTEKSINWFDTLFI